MDAGEPVPDIADVPVERRDVDGVPAFFAEGPAPMSAGLVFRVGQADERLVERGLTHLVEHLALAPLADVRMSNGTVAMTTTSFDVRGEPEEVRDFINGVVRSLAGLPFDRLDVERRVLRTEDQRRSGSLFSLAHYLRFGPAGHGTIDCAELGLPGATAESVDAWRRRWFTRENAVLWFSGEPPEGLDLSPLASGERVAPPEPAPYPYKYPAWYAGADGYIAVSMLGERTMATWAAQAILRERLHNRLRKAEGRSYAVSVDNEALTPGTYSIFVLTDTLPEEAEPVRDAVLVEMTKLARQGAEKEEVDLLRSLMRRSLAEPGFPAFAAERHAWHSLKGIKPQEPPEIDAELAALTAEDIAAAMSAAQDSALWLVPRAIGMSDQRIRALPAASESSVQGKTYGRPRGFPQDGATHKLVVGDAGVSLTYPDFDPSTIEFDACPAMQVWEDGARTLWGADGIRIFLHPGDWKRGDEAIAAVDAAVTTDVRVDMGEPSGYTPPVESGGGWNPFRRR